MVGEFAVGLEPESLRVGELIAEASEAAVRGLRAVVERVRAGIAYSEAPQDGAAEAKDVEGEPTRDAFAQPVDSRSADSQILAEDQRRHGTGQRDGDPTQR